MHQGTAVHAGGTYCAIFTVSCIRQDPFLPFISLIKPCIKLLIDIGTKNEYTHMYVQGTAVTAPYIEGRALI